mmetsp:Transcript_11481/g.35445  ORF Transcript_11481/g.35445 Transcript_11481/m.35445 type:complete len:244 (+) Transcript_11481:1080-1811(+)
MSDEIALTRQRRFGPNSRRSKGRVHCSAASSWPEASGPLMRSVLASAYSAPMSCCSSSSLAALSSCACEIRGHSRAGVVGGARGAQRGSRRREVLRRRSCSFTRTAASIAARQSRTTRQESSGSVSRISCASSTVSTLAVSFLGASLAPWSMASGMRRAQAVASTMRAPGDKTPNSCYICRARAVCLSQSRSHLYSAPSANATICPSVCACSVGTGTAGSSPFDGTCSLVPRQSRTRARSASR